MLASALGQTSVLCDGLPRWARQSLRIEMLAYVAAQSNNDMGVLSQGCQMKAFWRPATDLR